MTRLFSLKARIILQFLLIVSPFAIALLYQTHKETERATQLSRLSQRLAIADAVKGQYTHFVNGVVDAVDSGRLSAKSIEALKQAQTSLQELREQDPSQGSDRALEQIANTLAAVTKDPGINALVPLRTSINDLAAQIAKISQDYDQAIKAVVPSAIETAKQQKTVVLFVVFLTVVITAGFVRFMITGLTRPLRVAESVAQQIASGHITRSLAVSKGNELGKLLDSLVTMNASLFTLLSSVQAAAGTLSQSVGAIAHGNESISKRADQQATFLKDAALRMKAVASTVEQNTASARQADQLAAGASRSVRAGDEAM